MTGAMKTLGILVGAALIVATGAASSRATEYVRNDLICNDFEDAEENYKRNPESVHAQVGYGLCLIARGDDFEGLKFWHDAAEFHNDVHAAFLLAKYIETKGTFNLKKPDWEKLDETIKAYFRVLLYINMTHGYPWEGGYVIYEDENQLEIKSRFRVPLYYYNKFFAGFEYSENAKLLTSPSYKGDRDLDVGNALTFDAYVPHTHNSLKLAIEYGDECAGLPMKRHFKPDYYSRYTTACRIIADLSRELLPLEIKRRHLIQDDHPCAKDLPECAEYYELTKKMDALIDGAYKEIKKTGV